MGKRDELIAKYADDLKNKCGMTPDMDLLTKVTIGCGPSIYNADASTVAGSQQSELETVKNSFLMKKLGLADGPELMAAIDKAIETYGRSERNKYRAVIYYMLTKHFGKESIYGSCLIRAAHGVGADFPKVFHTIYLAKHGPLR